MLKRLLCFVFCCIVFSTVSQVFAKGIFIPPGAKANALGGAFIGIADDSTAIYWNPAGLSQLDKSGVEVSAFYVNSSAKSNTSLGNAASPDVADGDFPISLVYPTEPSIFKSKELKTSAVIPFIAGHTQAGGVNFALGFYGTGGGGGKWEDKVKDVFAGVDDISAKVDSSYGFLVTNLSAAKEIYQDISIGVGVDLVNMMDKTQVSKDYEKNAGSVLNAALGSYGIKIENSGTGFGTQFVAGVLYSPLENLGAGFVYRSGAILSLSGKAKFVRTGLASVGSPDVNFETDYDEKYYYPTTYGIGVAYDPISVLTLSFGVDVSNYSSKKSDITYKSQLPGLFADTNKSSEWSDITQLRLGAEYRHNEKLSFYSGLQSESSPISHDKMTLLDLNKYTLTSLSLGVGYYVGLVELQVVYAHTFSDKLEKNGRTFEYPVDTFRLSAGYGF